MKIRKEVTVIVALAVVALLLVCMTVVILRPSTFAKLTPQYRSSQKRIAEKIAELRGQEEPVTVQDMAGTQRAYEAGKQFKLLGEKMVGTSVIYEDLLERVLEGSSAVNVSLLSPDELTLIETQVTDNQSGLEKIWHIEDLESARFEGQEEDFNFDNWILLEVSYANDISNILRGEFLLAVKGKDKQKCIDVIRKTGLLAKVVSNCPYFAHSSVAARMSRRCIQLVDIAVDSFELDRSEVLTIDQELKKLDRLFRVRRAIHGERAQMLRAFERFNAEGFFYTHEDGHSFDALVAVKPSPILASQYCEELLIYLTDLAEIGDDPGNNSTSTWESIELAFGTKHAALDSKTPYVLFVPGISSLREDLFRIRNEISRARLEMRCEEYRKEFAEYPRSLNLLIDESMPEVPIDLFIDSLPTYSSSSESFSIEYL